MKKKLITMMCACMTAMVVSGCSATPIEDNNSDSSSSDVIIEDEDDVATLEDVIEEETVVSTANLSNETIMTIDGVEIPKSLYMLYDYTTTQNFYAMTMGAEWDEELEGSTEQEFIDQRVVETLRSIVATTKYAEENGIEITIDDKTEIMYASEEFVANMPADALNAIGFDASTLEPYMQESYIHSKVYDSIISGYMIDAEGREAFYNENAEAIAKDYTVLDLNSVLVDDITVAQEVYELALEGADFNELFLSYDVALLDPTSDETGELSINQGQFLNTFPIEEELYVGQIIGPSDMNGSYFIFLVENIDTPAGDDLDEIIDSIYVSNEEITYADEVISDMIVDQEIVVDEDVLNSVQKFYY